MFRKLFVQWAVALGLLFFSTHAHAISMRADVPDSSYQALGASSMFSCVGAVYSQDSTTGLWTPGSAVLVAPDWILTAAHVVDGPDGTGLGVSGINFYLGTNLNSSYTLVTGDQIYLNPGYTFMSSESIGGSGVDLALVHLTTSVADVAPAVLFSGQDEVGTHAYIAGFGRPSFTDGTVLARDLIRRAGENAVTSLGDSVLGVESQYMLAELGPTWNTDFLPLEAGVSPGDSGGGWFNDAGELIGISSFYRGDHTLYGSVSGAVRVSEYAGWANDTMASVPEPGSLVLLASGVIGALSFLRRRRRRFQVRQNPLRKWIVPFALLLSVLSVGTPARAIIMREDVPSSTYEAYGQQSVYQSVGWVGAANSNGHVYAEGSGVYLGNGWVLTAAHVVENGINASGFLELQFGVGSNFLTDWGEYGVADSWSIYPGYSSSADIGTTPDLALVHLSTTLSVSAAVLYTGTVAAGDTISMVGYGKPGTDSTGPLAFDGEKRGGTNIVNGYGGDEVGYSWFSPDYMFARFDTQYSGETALECMGARYDSGGGSFTEANGQWYVSGIMELYTGYGTPGTLEGSYTGILGLNPYIGWINETTGADVPEPGSFLLLTVAAFFGLPFAVRRKRQALG